MVTNLIFTVVLLSVVKAREFLDPVAKLNAYPSDNDVNVNGPWDEKWFSVKLDHFTYSDTRTFKMRFLWNNTFYKEGGPIFFYTGNEGGIEGFATATGIMWDLAPKFHAAIIFAEHRYYGKTLPFGNESYSSISNLGFLTSEQALADFAALLVELKTPRNAFNYTYPEKTPVIAFGGSYGGMLSAWFRMKYPYLVTGAWAASAPLIYFRGGGVDPGVYDLITTRTYTEAGCNRFIIANTWNAILNLSSTDNGRQFLNAQFRVHPNSTIRKKEDGQNLNNYLREAIEYMAMVDYPYSTSFLQPLPGWPVKVACSFMNDSRTNFSDMELSTMMYKAANVYYNTTGKLQYNCINPTVCGDPATASLASGNAWTWQECSEIVLDMCAKGGRNDFFWDECNSNPFDILASICKSSLKNLDWTTANWDIDAISTTYGLTAKYASNIILTQGYLDPWSGGGYKASSSDIRSERELYAIEIPGSAHHLDLRTPNTCDPNTVKNARYQIVQILTCWINSCSTPVKLRSLPNMVVPPAETKCVDVNNGYPWGQNTASNSLALSLFSMLTLLVHILLF